MINYFKYYDLGRSVVIWLQTTPPSPKRPQVILDSYMTGDPEKAFAAKCVTTISQTYELLFNPLCSRMWRFVTLHSGLAA